MSKRIQIACQGSDYLNIDDLENFQGNLKDITTIDIDKIKKSILKYGFSFPVLVWGNNIIDGHQRILAVKELLKENYLIDKIPCVNIIAKTKKEAAEKLLIFNSKFSKITDEGLYCFLNSFDIDVSDIHKDLVLPDIDIDRFISGYIKDINPEDVAQDLSKKPADKIAIEIIIDSDIYFYNKKEVLKNLNNIESIGACYEIKE